MKAVKIEMILTEQCSPEQIEIIVKELDEKYKPKQLFFSETQYFER